MKVYLLNAPYKPRFTRDMRWQDTGRGGTLYYPIWLAYATGMIEQAGIETKLVDCAARKWNIGDVMIDISLYRPDYIILDTSFPSLNNDIAVADYIKKYISDARIIMVGAPCSQFADRLLKNPAIDHVIPWEFDFGLRDFLTGKTRKGFSTSEELDSIPFVSQVYKKHLNARDYMLTYSHSLYPNVQIFAGRGCPCRCTFCSWPQTLTGHAYRQRSIGNILDEFQWIEQEYKEIKQIFLEDDTFTINEKTVLDFCNQYHERKLKIPWGAQARVGLSYETMRAMRKANCLMVDVGYESGNNSILQHVKKNIKVEQFIPFAKEARRAGLSIHGNWIIGLPGEDAFTLNNTWHMIKATKADAITVAVVSPFPGTEMYKELKEAGYMITDNPNDYLDSKGHQKSIVSYPQLSNTEIREAVDRILKDYYLSPSYIPIALRRICSRHGLNELNVLAKSALAFVKYVRGK